MLSQRAKGAWLQHWKASEIVRHNAVAPEGKMWSLSEGDYVDIPTCEEGYTFSLDTYRCEPNLE